MTAATLESRRSAAIDRVIAPIGLTFRIHRFEVSLVVLATILSVVVSALVMAYLRGSGYAAACFASTDQAPEGLPAGVCFETLPTIGARIARASLGLAAIFPYIAGLLVGVPVISREIDSGTARLAWSLSPSRLRWFGHRVLPILGLLVLCSFVIGVVADQLAAFQLPTSDLSRSFELFRGRGVLLAVQAFVVGSIGVALGALLGRPVPTFVLALILGAGSIQAFGSVHQRLLLGEAVPSEDNAEFGFNSNDLYLDSRFRTPEGDLVTYEEMEARYPTAFSGEDPNLFPAYVALVIPAERYRIVETREAIGLTGIALLAVLVGAATVLRRKPS
jgi:hypothetical protein